MAGTALPPTITDATVTLSYAGVQSGVVSGQYFGYCTLAEVKFELRDFDNLPSLLATNGTPPLNMNGNSLMAMEITYAALELQNMLDHHYQMPYTGTNGPILTTLREMNAKLAAARIIDRGFVGGQDTTVSPTAAELRSWVELIVVDIKNGAIRWDAPFGDATPRGMLPVYQLSAGATVQPSPYDLNPLNANPVFTMGAARFRGRGDNF